MDLLKQLVSSRSRVIPSIQELAKPELARRVRDRLVQEDQFELAMEVSTKCQLDTGVVWSAWGVACLRCGELERAREKFKHCFQVSLSLTHTHPTFPSVSRSLSLSHTHTYSFTHSLPCVL